MFCELCGEHLSYDVTNGKKFHVNPAAPLDVPSWDACFRAAKSDTQRILRVQREFAKAEPLAAWNMDGNR